MSHTALLLSVVAVASFVRADLLAALDTNVLNAAGNTTSIIRLVSSMPLGPRLNESDFLVLFSPWSAAGQPAGYACCTMSIEVFRAAPGAYLATLAAAPASLTVLPTSRLVCVAVTAASVCNATLVLMAPYSATIQSYRIAVALDAIGGPATSASSVFITLAAPLDPCPAEMLIEAALPSLLSNNPMRINITTNASTFTSTVTATLRNEGFATASFFASLSCPSTIAIVHPDTALRCTLAPGSTCPVEWIVVSLQSGVLPCQMRFAVARLPCWSGANKFFETQIAIIVPADETAASATALIAVTASLLGLIALALLTLVIAWATAGCLRVHTEVDAAQSRASAASFFRTRLQRKLDPALSFAPLRDRDTNDN